MEISNQTVYSYDTLMEYHRRHVKDLRVLSIVLLVISSVSLAVSMAEQIILLALDKIEAFKIPGTIYTFFWVLVLMIVYTVASRKSCRRQAAKHSIETYLFTHDGFAVDAVSDTATTHVDYKYEAIIKVTESKSAFYLYTARNAAHIVDKQGFTEATEQDFRDLLRTVIEGKKLQIK